MRLVFKETTGNAFSLHSIKDFYSTARKICEESFVVAAPEGSAEIIINHIPQKYMPILLFVLEVTEFSSDKNMELAKDRLVKVAKAYNWKLLGILEKNTINQQEIMLKWIEKESENA